MWGYVSVTSLNCSVRGNFSGEHSCAAPGVFRISAVDKSDCIGISCKLGRIPLFFSASKVGCSYSHCHALAYKSSSFRLTSRSGFHPYGMICISFGG